MKFGKFLRTPILKNICERLRLHQYGYKRESSPVLLESQSRLENLGYTTQFRLNVQIILEQTLRYL